MPLSLDKIKALIRLANKNPNENEANLAARKVCKILETSDFEIVAKMARPIPKPAPMTWNDVQRSPEPQWQATPYDPPADNPFDQFFRDRGAGGVRGGWDFADFMKKYGFKSKAAPTENEWSEAEAERDRNEAKREQHTSNYSGSVRYNPFTGQSEKKPEEMRKCVKCGFQTMTSRLDTNPWICSVCQWVDYNQEKEKI